MQTDSRLCVFKGSCSNQGVSCSNSIVTEEHMKIIYPSFYTHTGQADNIIGTMDDIILDNQPRYLILRESIRFSVPVINTSATRIPSPDPDSPDETEDIIRKITGDFDFAKKYKILKTLLKHHQLKITLMNHCLTLLLMLD